MFRKLSVALLLAASPALASESEIKVDQNGQAYKIKKVCRTVEVSGSFIPRTSCVNKKVPVKNPQAAGQQPTTTTPGGGTADSDTAKAPENQ